MSTMVESLREVPLFADLSERDLERLVDSMKELAFEPGDYIGEMAPIDGDDRMASVHAEGELRVRESQARHVAAAG